MVTMREQRSRYPVGIQTFSKIRQGGYVYVDKTALVYRLANESDGAFFLSRPRRFGKSLLVSTLQAYFEGRRDLFDGLEIEELESVWESRPVIRLDLSTVKTCDPETLRDLLDAVLAFEEAKWGRDDAMKTPRVASHGPHSSCACANGQACGRACGRIRRPIAQRAR